MRNVNRLVAIVACAAMITCHAQGQTGLSALFGVWKIEKIITGADIVGLSTQQAEAFLGKRIDLHLDNLSYGDFTCNPPHYKRETMSAREFRDGYKLTNEDMRLLDLPSRITMYQTECITFIPRGTHQLVMEDYGIFFLAV